MTTKYICIYRDDTKEIEFAESYTDEYLFDLNARRLDMECRLRNPNMIAPDGKAYTDGPWRLYIGDVPLSLA